MEASVLLVKKKSKMCQSAFFADQCFSDSFYKLECYFT
jgi:hypothetical protein